MTHAPSIEDKQFVQAFEAFAVAPQDFDHEAHVRLAYAYLCEGSPDEANGRMKQSLLAFLAHLGADQGKFHETITKAWILAVKHFMAQSPSCGSFAEFVERNPVLLDSNIMLSHYSAQTLFSDVARAKFVEPDIEAIPLHV